MSGDVTGGWPFVWAAYAVTATMLGGYTVSLLLRYRAERKRRDTEPK